MMIRTLLAACALALAVIPPATAADGGVCAQRFPEVAWLPVDTPIVDVYAAGVPEGHMARYAGEIGESVERIVDRYGPLTATVCLFDPKSGFDTSRFVSGSDRLHAMLFPDDDLLLMSTENVGLTGEAVAFGLAHLALWQYSGGEGFPEPQASTLARYFRSEVRGRAIYDHAEAKASNFFGPDVVTAWSSGAQSNPLIWDPETGRTSSGGAKGPTSDALSGASTYMADLVRYGVRTIGDDMFTNPDPAVWTRLEAAWRSDLTDDLLGIDRPTTGWKPGLAVAVGIVIGALVAVLLGHVSKRRRRRRPETPDPIPGFFDDGSRTAG